VFESAVFVTIFGAFCIHVAPVKGGGYYLHI